MEREKRLCFPLSCSLSRFLPSFRPSFLPVTCQCPGHALPLFFRARGIFPTGFASRLREGGGSSTSAFARLHLTQLLRVSLHLAVSLALLASPALLRSLIPLITGPIYSERRLDPWGIAETYIFAYEARRPTLPWPVLFAIRAYTRSGNFTPLRIRATFGSFRLAHGNVRRARRAG